MGKIYSPTRLLRIGLALFATFIAVYYFGNIISWVILAWVLSLVGRPIVDFLGRIRYKRFGLSQSVRAAMTILFFYVSFGLLALMLAPTIIHQASNLAKVDYNGFSEKLNEFSDDINAKLIGWGLMKELPKTTTTRSDSTDAKYVNEQNTAVIKVDSLLTAGGDSITRTHLIVHLHLDDPVSKQKADSSAIAEEPVGEQFKKSLFKFFNPNSIIGVFGGLTSLLGNLIASIASITFILFFFLNDPNLFERAVLALSPNRMEKDVSEVIDRIKTMLGRYFIGILVEIAAIMIFVSSALLILGVPNALLLGLMAALLNTIPYLGPLIAAVFGSVLCITTGLDQDFYTVTLWWIVKVFGVFSVMQFLDNNFFQPWIFSKSVLAHPLEIFVVIIMGAQLAGVSGMVLAVPVYTVIRVIAAEFFGQFKVVRELTAQLNEHLDQEDEDKKDDPA